MKSGFHSIPFKWARSVVGLVTSVTNKGLLALVLMLALQTLPYGAEGREGRSGPEWTFTNSELIELGRLRDQDIKGEGARLHDAFQEKLMSKWFRLLKQKCKACRITQNEKSFSVTFKNGHWFNVAQDPWALEVTASPMTLSDLKENQNLFQTWIWDIAQELDLKPHERIGGGHIHLEISSFFNNDRLLYRNFIVDLANNPELFLGGLGFDLLNAPPLAVLTENQRRSFELLLVRFDRGQMSIPEFNRQLNLEVYSQTFYPIYIHQQTHPEKYQAVNVTHGVTLELRGLAPQRSALQHLKIVTLFQNRIEYLKKLKEPLRYENTDYSGFVKTSTERGMETHTTSLSPDFIEQKVRRYVESSQLSWSDYREVMTENLRPKPAGAISCRHIFF